MIYIMKRTQLYLDDEEWEVLRVRARQASSSISELVRQAVRDKYLEGRADREEAFRAVIGIWKDRADLPDTERYVRGLRKSTRSRRVRR